MSQDGVIEAAFCALSYIPIMRKFACNVHTSSKKVNVIKVNVTVQDLILMHSFKLDTNSW